MHRHGRPLSQNSVFPRAFLKHNWWVLLCLGLVYFFYSHGMQKKRETLASLEKRLVFMQQQKLLAEETREELRLQVKSQEDPAWVEMTLMKGLGLVPEGQRKIYFKQQ